MARHFPTGGQDYGPIAFDDATTAPTVMYLYPERFGVFAGKQHLWGQKSFPDNALEDGVIVTELATKTTDPDLSTIAIGVETEGPYPGDLVVSFTMGIVP